MPFLHLEDIKHQNNKKLPITFSLQNPAKDSLSFSLELFRSVIVVTFQTTFYFKTY
jgi:hypothetical protein